MCKRKERSEVGVTRDDDPLFVACQVEEDVILCALESAFGGYGQHRGRLRGAVEQVAVIGSGRRGTSRDGLKRYLAISNCVGSEAQRGRNIRDGKRVSSMRSPEETSRAAPPSGDTEADAPTMHVNRLNLAAGVQPCARLDVPTTFQL